MSKIIFFVLLLTNILFGCAMCGNASFVYTNIDLLITQESIEKLSITWMFDDVVSTQLINGYDKNKNHKFDQSELNDMQSVISKQEPSFLTSISIDGKRKKIRSLENFKAYIKDKSVYYSFEVTLGELIRDKKSVIELYFVDQSHTLAFLYQDKGVNINNPNHYKVKQDFGFKVIQNMMAVVNALTIEVQK
jgi:ABC-type uncharacterized transport system substrate-binding protein